MERLPDVWRNSCVANVTDSVPGQPGRLSPEQHNLMTPDRKPANASKNCKGRIQFDT